MYIHIRIRVYVMYIMKCNNKYLKILYNMRVYNALAEIYTNTIEIQ